MFLFQINQKECPRWDSNPSKGLRRPSGYPSYLTGAYDNDAGPVGFEPTIFRSEAERPILARLWAQSLL